MSLDGEETADDEADAEDELDDVTLLTFPFLIISRSIVPKNEFEYSSTIKRSLVLLLNKRQFMSLFRWHCFSSRFEYIVESTDSSSLIPNKQQKLNLIGVLFFLIVSFSRDQKPLLVRLLTMAANTATRTIPSETVELDTAISTQFVFGLILNDFFSFFFEFHFKSFGLNTVRKMIKFTLKNNALRNYFIWILSNIVLDHFVNQKLVVIIIH